jgi:enamine deaminase RidA (YjgF/YER057c/UK114 family)
MPTSNPSPVDGRTPEERLAALGLVLPDAPRPVASYIPFRVSGNLLFVSGQIPFRSGAMIATGAVPDQVSVEVALDCSRQCALNVLAQAKAALGELSRVRQVVRLGVFVCSQAGFWQQPKIGNAASDLMVQVFGEAGQHARAAVGSIALPLGAPVEIDAIFEVG